MSKDRRWYNNRLGDKTARHYTLEHIIDCLQIQVEVSGSQKMAAKEIGVSDQYLSDVLKFKRAPGAKILKAYGLEPVAAYKSIGT